MKAFFFSFGKALKTEFIKKKRSAIFWLSLFIGALVPIVFFIFSLYYHKESGILRMPTNYYFEYFKDALKPFANFFFPVLIVFCASKIAQIDHKNRGWHLLETQPVAKFSIYFSKFTILLLSSLIAIISFLFFGVLLNWILSLIYEPPADKIMSIPFAELANIGLRLFVSSLCLTAFQYVLSVRIPHFMWSLLIGFVLIVSYPIVRQANISFNWYLMHPLSQVSSFPQGSNFGYWLTYADWISVLYSIFFLYVGYQWYRLKKFALAFFPLKNALRLLILTILTIAAVIWFIVPKQQKAYDKTILSGHIDAADAFTEVALLEKYTDDTITKITLNNNTFYKEIKGDLANSDYIVSIDDKIRIPVYFGKNDSIDFKIYAHFGRKLDVKIGGTRIVENLIGSDYQIDNLSYKYFMNNERFANDENKIMKAMQEDWETSLLTLKKRTTADNLLLRKDFLERTERIYAVSYLNDWQEYVKKRQALYPDKVIVPTKFIQSLNEKVSLNDSSLVNNNIYGRWVFKKMIESDERDVSDNTKTLDALVKLQSGYFKDYLLFIKLDETMSAVTNSSERDSIFSKYIVQLTKASYKDRLHQKKELYNRLSAGAVAPDFEAYDINNKQYTLKDFRGKYVLFDVWATWCGPCKGEAPFFKSKALKYKDKPIQFVSLSVDENKKDWEIAYEKKSGSVTQLYVKDKKAFYEKYNISGIPHFILIDPNGNFISAYFARPSDKNFDEYLKSYLK